MPPQQPQFQHFVPDEEPQQFSHFVPDETAATAPSLKPEITAHNLEHTPYVPVHSMRDLGKDALIAASNFGAGTLQVPHAIGSLLLDPKETVKGMFTDPYNIDPTGVFRMAKDVSEGQGAELAGNMVGGAALMGGANAIGRGINAAADPVRMYRSPAIPEPEAFGRRLTDLLKVNPQAYPSTMRTLTEHGPVVRDYMNANNFGSSPLEVAKAMQGAGQEATGHFQQHLIEPNSMAETGEGPLGDVYKRVTAINKELSPKYRNQLTVKTDAQLAREQELTAERDRLNDAMYSTLSYRSGLPVEEIRAMNQRGAGLQSAGEEADAAQQLRKLGYGSYNAGGQPLPLPMADRALKLVNLLRGGDEAVQGRKIGRLMQKMPEDATPLPDAERMNSFRHAAEQEELGQTQARMAKAEANQATAGKRLPGAVRMSLEPQMVDPSAELQARAGRMAERTMQRNSDLPKAQPVPPENPLNKYLTGARERQALLKNRNQPRQ